MNDRVKKIEELMETFHSLKRPVVSKGHSPKMPRITPSQWMVLRVINHHEACTVKDISQTLGITSSAATQLVAGLIKSRYVVRKENEKDRRKVTLTLSPKSRKHIEQVKKQILERMINIFKVLNDQEFEQLYKLHKKIVDSLTSK